MTPDALPPAAHRRWNPLAGRWVLVTPGRLARPWQGEQQAPARDDVPAYDPACYMCPGNVRAGGAVNPRYAEPFVFDNDFPALRPGDAWAEASAHPLLQAEAAGGVCRVVCYSPRHDATLARLSVPEIRAVVDCWADEVAALRGRPSIVGVQVFENRGAMMGASNPHPHGQIWATSFVPDEVDAEARAQARYTATHAGADLLGDYLVVEVEERRRVVSEHDEWVCLVPYWATWPFETLLVPRRRVGSIEDLTSRERDDLSVVLSRLCQTYDRLFGVPFPYSMGAHVRPATADDSWRLHFHFYPPLLRSATVRKFMVGFELLGMPQRDFTPEEAADRLRAAGGALPAPPRQR